MRGVFKAAFFLGIILFCADRTLAQPHLVSVGDHKLSINCIGNPGPYTVVLMAGGGRTSDDWVYVESGVAKFARVCTYDRAGLGRSGQPKSLPQTIDEIVADLHELLRQAGEKQPFILVAHSVAGIHARYYATKFPSEVVGMVLVDSSHEEQLTHSHEIFPSIAHAPEPGDMKNGFIISKDQHLLWKTNIPLVVLSRGQPSPTDLGASEAQMAQWDDTWKDLQKDLASRSTHGTLRIAEQSGHMIPLEQPEIIVQAIRDVSPKP